MFTLYKKELNYYLNNPLGYIFVILFAVFANFLYVKDIFAVGQVSMRAFFGLIPWLLMIFVPALTMRAIAEEKKNNTIETLLMFPISETEIVLAKFLSLLTVVSIGLMLTLALPIGLIFLSKIYIPEVIIGYLGIVLLSGFFISLSLFFSSLSKNQVVSLLLSVIVIFLLLVINTDFNVGILPKSIQDSLSYFSPSYHAQNFIKGLIDIRSLFYFLSGVAVFLFITIIDLEKRD